MSRIPVNRCGPRTRLSSLVRGDTPGHKVCQSCVLNSARRGLILMELAKENILVNAAGHACLSDIGFATLAHNGELKPDETESGTPSSRWTAPEVSKNSEFSKQSDVFSFGFVAVEVRS